MSGATGHALEWALALLRAPGERHALRQRPLPPGMDRLLAIAAGAVPAGELAAAATALGEPEAKLREAAQFYAREVLFHPQADAYRTLGVAADASAETIKAHHRLLQHWLHPDRLQSEDDSVFASRVNSAWNNLRTEERRRGYDLRCSDERERGAEAAVDIGGDDMLRRAPAAWRPPSVEGPPPRRWRHRLPVLGLFAVCLVLGWMIVRGGGQQIDDWAWMEEKKAAAAREAAEAERARAEAEGREVGPAASSPGSKRTVVAAAIERPVQALAALVGLGKKTDKVEAPPASPPKPVVERIPVAAAKVVPEATEVKVLPVDATPIAEAPPNPASPSKSGHEAVTAVVKPPAPAVEPVAPVAKAAVDADSPTFFRIQSAQQVGNQLAKYLATPDRLPPPIWNSPAIMSSASGLRQDLHRRGRAKVGPPKWRVGNEVASLTMSYRVDGGEAQSGLLTADMIWRENRWLITGLSMEQGE